MNQAEWESLCDGCGHCCLVKLEDDDSGEVFLTNVACHMLDMQTCCCRDYENRVQRVSTCLVLGPDKPKLFRLLPDTCAYRRLAEGRDLPDWHPLLSNERHAARRAGVSVSAYAISEEYIHPEQLHLHIIEKL